jgi:hypothetical protein
MPIIIMGAIGARRAAFIEPAAYTTVRRVVRRRRARGFLDQ